MELSAGRSQICQRGGFRARGNLQLRQKRFLGKKVALGIPLRYMVFFGKGAGGSVKNKTFIANVLKLVKHRCAPLILSLVK